MNLHNSDVKFYKYLSPKASIATLENKTVKWSNPKLFNDPFDFPLNMDFSFSNEEFYSALVDEIIKIITAKDNLILNDEALLVKLINSIRSQSIELTIDNFAELIDPANIDIKENFNYALKNFRRSFEELRNSTAVLCVSKKYDDLLMWAHYAKDHTGMVIKFRCLEEFDRPLCAAKEVKYVSKFPLIASLDDYVKYVTGQKELSFTHIMDYFAFTKSDDWMYEDEWRCVSTLRDQKNGYDFDIIIPQEIEAIYLGCRIEDKFKANIIKIIEENYPDTEIYLATPRKQFYGLNFEQIR